jgi:hypothetical protein
MVNETETKSSDVANITTVSNKEREQSLFFVTYDERRWKYRENTKKIGILLRQKQKRITNPAIFLTAEDPK